MSKVKKPKKPKTVFYKPEELTESIIIERALIGALNIELDLTVFSKAAIMKWNAKIKDKIIEELIYKTMYKHGLVDHNAEFKGYFKDTRYKLRIPVVNVYTKQTVHSWNGSKDKTRKALHSTYYSGSLPEQDHPYFWNTGKIVKEQLAKAGITDRVHYNPILGIPKVSKKDQTEFKESLQWIIDNVFD